MIIMPLENMSNGAEISRLKTKRFANRSKE